MGLLSSYADTPHIQEFLHVAFGLGGKNIGTGQLR